MTWTVLKSTIQAFCRLCLNLGCLIFPHDQTRVMDFGGRTSQRGSVFLVASGVHDLSLVVLTLVTWLKWCLPGFSTVVTPLLYILCMLEASQSVLKGRGIQSTSWRKASFLLEFSSLTCPVFWIKGFRDHSIISPLSDVKVHKSNLFAQDLVQKVLHHFTQSFRKRESECFHWNF